MSVENWLRSAGVRADTARLHDHQSSGTDGLSIGSHAVRCRHPRRSSGRKCCPLPAPAIWAPRAPHQTGRRSMHPSTGRPRIDPNRTADSSRYCRDRHRRHAAAITPFIAPTRPDRRFAIDQIAAEPDCKATRYVAPADDRARLRLPRPSSGSAHQPRCRCGDHNRPQPTGAHSAPSVADS